jgi:transcriptional regulator GlxA family with amidase domain
VRILANKRRYSRRNLERRFVKDERMTLAEWEELYRRRRIH